jgi:hypothetical protein
MTLGQDEPNAIVYGMPRVAYELGHVMEQVSLQNMAHRICDVAKTHGKVDFSKATKKPTETGFGLYPRLGVWRSVLEFKVPVSLAYTFIAASGAFFNHSVAPYIGKQCQNRA